MRFYELLLRLLPSRFRARHGSEMARLFEEQLREARRDGAWAVAWQYLRCTVDVAHRAWLEGRAGHRAEGGTMGWGHWWEMVTADTRQALRGFRRAPGFTATAVATLALGIGVIAAVYSVVNGVVLRPLPYPDADGLVVVYNQYPSLEVTRGSQSPGDLDDYRAQAHLLTEVGSVSTFPQTLLQDGRPERVEVALVTPGFLSMLGVTPALGRDIRADDDHDVVLVSHAYWRDELGASTEALGTLLSFAGVSKTVIGVLPADFRLVVPSGFAVPSSPALWTPIPASGWGRDTGDRSAHWMNVVGRLSRGASLPQLQQQMDAVAEAQRRLLPHRAEREARIDVVPLQAEIVAEIRPALFALLLAAGIVVLIACANVANLLLVRAERRRSEIAVRTALGAGFGRVLHRALTEGLILGSVGAALGVAIAWLALDAIPRLGLEGVPRLEDVVLDLGVMGFVALVTGAVTLLFSLAPAMLSNRRDVVPTMRDAGRSGPTRRAHALSSGLIVGELALSLVLLLGSGLMVRSALALLDIDPGFEAEAVLTFSAPLPPSVLQAQPAGEPRDPADHDPVRKRYYDELARILGAIPRVTDVAGIWPIPLSGNVSGSTYATEATAGDEEGQLASSQLVTPQYFETMRIPFVEGRTFLPEERGDRLVIDRTLAEQLWPGESALGKRLQIGWWSGPVWGRIVGVVEPVRSHSLREPNPPTVYRLGTVFAYGAMTMAVRVDGDPLAIVDDVRDAVAVVEGEAPVIDVRLMSDYVADQSARTRFVLSLVGVFAVLALGLAAIGLYGVISYAVAQRTREYGIRLAFGSGRGRVFRLVLRRGGLLTSAGLAIGLLAALGVRRIVEPFLFGVAAADPMTIAVIAMLIAVVSLVSCAVPAVRATLVDPVESLRTE